jgi:hypothetical protein
MILMKKDKIIGMIVLSPIQLKSKQENQSQRFPKLRCLGAVEIGSSVSQPIL